MIEQPGAKPGFENDFWLPSLHPGKAREASAGCFDLCHCPTLRGIRVDAHTIHREKLDIEVKTRSNLFPWNGQFSPQLIHTLLDTYAVAKSFVLDPFMGSGTVLVEAGALGLPAFGSEINPAACNMAQTYRLINESRGNRVHILDRMGEILTHAIAGPSLFHANDVRTDVKSKLVGLWSAEDNEHIKRLLETLIVLSDFYNSGLTQEKVLSKWNRLKDTVANLPVSNQPIEMANSDSRALPLSPDAVDLVITSPPYINVFNYHQQYRASVEALGWDLLHVARSEVGSNRKHRQNRFLTVVQYCLDMTAALQELLRVCKRSARIIVVVGRQSNVLKTPFFNGEIISRLAERCVELTAEKRQERVFKNKFGTMIVEDILHFRPTGQRTNCEDPTKVAEEVLRTAMTYSPSESLPALKRALDGIGEVKASPLYALQPRKQGHADPITHTALGQAKCDTYKQKATSKRPTRDRGGD